MIVVPFVQDNIFVIVVALVQYREHVRTGKDAFYKLSKPEGQIKALVFDGKEGNIIFQTYGDKN